MKIIITGALGHIGSFLFRKFIKEEFISKIFILDNLQSDRYCSLFNIPKNNKIKFLNIDLLNQKINVKADILIHLAAKTDAAQSHIYEKEFLNNRKITNNIIEYCNETKAKLIFASSTSVYGPQEEWVDENCSIKSLKPQSPYASTKLLEEKDITNKCNYNYLILRLGTIYGYSNGIRFQTAVNKFCFQASQKIPLTIWKTALNQRRPYLNLDDFRRCLLHIFMKNLIKNEIFNLVSNNYTVKDIILAIKNYVNNPKIEFVNHKIMNQLSYRVSNQKFCNTGFKFRARLKYNIKETLNKLKYF